jgi:hypothetical protein
MAAAQTLAARLRIRFVWLPRQAPELSPMDQLWRELKRLVAANRQAASIDALASTTTTWALMLTSQQAFCKAGMTSDTSGSESCCRTFGDLLSGASGKSWGSRQEGNAGRAARPMPTAPAPDEGMAVCIPVDCRAVNCIGDLLPALEAPTR